MEPEGPHARKQQLPDFDSRNCEVLSDEQKASLDNKKDQVFGPDAPEDIRACLTFGESCFLLDDPVIHRLIHLLNCSFCRSFITGDDSEDRNLRDLAEQLQIDGYEKYRRRAAKGGV